MSSVIKVNVQNSGFEETTTGWITESSSEDNNAAYTERSEAYEGAYCLKHYNDVPYQVSTYQIITGLSDGYYTLSAWTKNSGGQKACYLYAKVYDGSETMTSLPVSKEWTRVVVRGIHVTNGQCTIGLYSDANAGNWCMMDDVQLVKDDKPYMFLKGGDISELSYIESMGGKFYDENGAKKDCLEILKGKGFNFARLRLYNDPGNPDYSPSNRLPAGFQNENDILRLAKRAKAFGMQLQLTFYYSDYWSNVKPHEWEGLSFEELKRAVYEFTKGFMEKMKDQDTTPEYVSLGNEMQAGLLYPDGYLYGWSSDATEEEKDAHLKRQWQNLADLLNAGARAVREISPATRIILHLDDAGNYEKYDNFFSKCKEYGVDYDIIGASYYPFWTRKTVKEIVDFCNYESQKFNRDIVIMETGYNWNPTLPDGVPGQLADNGPYDNVYPSSPEGQRDFLYELFNGLKNVENGRVLGDLYWDPVMIEVPGVGWELGADNIVSNTTLFDFNGKALPALDAFKYNG